MCRSLHWAALLVAVIVVGLRAERREPFEPLEPLERFEPSGRSAFQSDYSGFQRPAVGPVWYERTTKLRFLTLRVPFSGLPLVIDYPERDWLVVDGTGAMLATFVQQHTEASVVLERASLAQPLKKDDVTEVFAQIEADLVKERVPGAAAFGSKLIDAVERRVAIVEYTRPGVREPQRVRQYSLPQGLVLYRLICTTTVARFGQYEAVFAHMAASLRANGPVAGR